MTDPYFAPHFRIRLSGLTLATEITDLVTSVTYDNNLDLADMFTVTLFNPNQHLLDSALFDIGKTVELHMGYGTDLQPMIRGDIAAIEPSFPESGPLTITVTGYDQSYKLRHNQPDRPPFQYVTDSEIAATIALEAGLEPVVDPSPIFHQDAVPQTGSDMALLKERARANYFDVYVRWNKLYFQLPRPDQTYVLEWGRTLSSYSPRIAATGQEGLQVVRGYNEELAQTIVATALSADFDPANIIEKLGTDALDILTSLGRRLIHDQPIKTPIQARTLATSIIQEVLEGLYEGSGSCIGIPELRAGNFVSIQGVGKRFSGLYRLRKVTHVIDSNGYRTQFEVTQRSGTNILPLLRKTVQDSPPPDGGTKFDGVMTAIVTDNNETRDSPSRSPLARVRVRYPALSDTTQSGWARCVTPMAGDQTGLYFLPEPGDEVLVAFEHGDPAQPLILGSLWNGKHRPPTTNDDGGNNLRMIKSRSGHRITFDDTPRAGKITITHATGSTITLDSDGSVTITAKEDLKLKAANIKVLLAEGGTMDVSNG